jgi:hypothetical protein
MKALTLTQPWATLVAIRAKKIETRSWGTGYRGPLAIHAAKGFPREARGICAAEPFRFVLQTHFGPEFYPNDLPLGCIVAITSVTGCKKMTSEWIAELTELERAFGLYEPGRFGWLLGSVEPLIEPAPVKGALGLWEWKQ